MRLKKQRRTRGRRGSIINVDIGWSGPCFREYLVISTVMARNVPFGFEKLVLDVFHRLLRVVKNLEGKDVCLDDTSDKKNNLLIIKTGQSSAGA